MLPWIIFLYDSKSIREEKCLTMNNVKNVFILYFVNIRIVI